MAAQISDVSGKSFDYIIIGGGTAGLTVANRLVEDPFKSVLVLEAGEANLDDPKILLGGGFGSIFGDEKYDWAFTTLPQKYANNRRMALPRGKGLGGSSAVNFYVWCKPPAADIDAWEELGNPGWNWEAHQKYALRAEEFSAASEEQLEHYAHMHNAEFRGKNGAIKTTPPGKTLQVSKMLLDTLQKQGVPLLEDPYGGNVTGCWIAASSLDRKNQWNRSYAATAYYIPNKDKPNFTVLTEAFGARVLFDTEKSGDDLVATGVEFVHKGKRYIAHATKEVICSAGALKSPQILELSGIGRRDVLEKIGVPVKVELPGVGENLQDHTMVGISYELDPKVAHETVDLFRNPEQAKEQLRLRDLDQDNAHRIGVSGFSYIPLQISSPNAVQNIIDGVTKHIEEQKKNGKLPPGLAEQYDIQLRMLQDRSLPDIELIAFPAHLTPLTAPEKDKPYLTVLCVIQHPFSRGWVHAKNNDPLDQPDIDGRVFENPYDLEIFLESAKFAKRIAETEPMKSGCIREIDPGASAKTDDELKEYLKNACSTCFHACGSASMLPRDKNGVVDPKLRVYGTKNLRVADLSVAPMEIAAHTQAAAYAIAEQLADILLEKI
ncbi:GMC oxidoreductase [Wolfiporia cocos MD-104 SS10]|uniref:GMC oxidoreductase n=1 Tax=Wolfiporia cocos (strain MD-104) TaxID=742152 RepID=A0A2H3JJZ2_WOLCO|nr:GMC oxidoreductase [Wolfiporia cocos MD-104 SS10]